MCRNSWCCFPEQRISTDDQLAFNDINSDIGHVNGPLLTISSDKVSICKLPFFYINSEHILIIFQIQIYLCIQSLDSRRENLRSYGKFRKFYRDEIYYSAETHCH